MARAEDISIAEVTKTFQTGLLRRKTAVENLSFGVPRGEIVGLLGANGSGKSTTLKMILGFLRPTKGAIWIDGKLAGTRESRKHIGYLPENPRFQKFLQGRQILEYFGRLSGMEGTGLRARTDEILELVGLKNAGGERVQGYSKGMTQRLAIAQALLHKPKILIFDEPMSGLDPLGRTEIRDLIRLIRDQMKDSTLFFSTHILSDVEVLCSSVALLKKGRLEVFCSVSTLMERDVESYVVTATGLPEALQTRLARDGVTTPSPLGTAIGVDGVDRLTALLAELRQVGAKIVGLSSKRAGLEETLFSDTGSNKIPRESGASA